MAEGILRKVQIVPIGAISQCARMQDHLLIIIGAASFTIGLFDHDSAAAGDQVSLLTIGGIDFTAAFRVTR